MLNEIFFELTQEINHIRSLAKYMFYLLCQLKQCFIEHQPGQLSESVTTARSFAAVRKSLPLLACMLRSRAAHDMHLQHWRRAAQKPRTVTSFAHSRSSLSEKLDCSPSQSSHCSAGSLYCLTCWAARQELVCMQSGSSCKPHGMAMHAKLVLQ